MSSLTPPYWGIELRSYDTRFSHDPHWITQITPVDPETILEHDENSFLKETETGFLIPVYPKAGTPIGPRLYTPINSNWEEEPTVLVTGDEPQPSVEHLSTGVTVAFGPHQKVHLTHSEAATVATPKLKELLLSAEPLEIKTIFTEALALQKARALRTLQILEKHLQEAKTHAEHLPGTLVP
jgi:hypothetical protein